MPENQRRTDSVRDTEKKKRQNAGGRKRKTESMGRKGKERRGQWKETACTHACRHACALSFGQVARPWRLTADSS
ncbi:hypothetical protein X777_16063 [Ooceraea biroi]|uniref:Uncharacterized protein n=1 Tax=Ooceraea biroi TaxID=2015173 RepID=A0A026WVZ1_OOCBI|nr:hypothetical protein X777_16063 [Ooceraea biroi]